MSYILDIYSSICYYTHGEVVTIGRNVKIKAARAALDMTQKALAEAVGISRQTMNAIEQGDYNPTISCAAPFAECWEKLLTNCLARRKINEKIKK